MHLRPEPYQFLIFAAVLAVMFFFGIKRKPPTHEDDRWIWWVAMIVLGTCIVYLGLKGFEIDLIEVVRDLF